MKAIIVLLLLAFPLLAVEPQVHRDLPYVEAKNERQTLDVYAPTEGKDHPVVVWVHGGGWQEGDKSEVQNKPKAFVEKGFVFVSINYRLLSEATIKEMADDVAKAIGWTCNHAKDYGGDPSTIFVMGHSAGAQLAALVCTDDRYLKAEGLSLTIIKGCIPLDGDSYDVPLQIATEAPMSAAGRRKLFGNVENQKALSPVTHVAKGKHIPPFLILHVADTPLTGGQAQRLFEVLQESEVSAKVVAAEGKTHDTINSELGLPDDRLTQEVWKFLARVATPQQTR